MKYFCFLLMVLPSLVSANEVANGLTPKDKAMTIQFEEDLVLDPDMGEEYLWTGLNVFVSVDDKGQLFVTDSSSNRILVFDDKGKHLETMGRFGQGPGEYQKLTIYQCFDDGTSMAFENRQNSSIQYFDKDRKFVRRRGLISQGQDFLYAWFSPDGKYFSSEFVINNQSRGTLSYRSGIYDAEKLALVKLFTKSTQPMPDFSTLLQDTKGVINFLGDTIKANDVMGLVAFANDGRIYTAKTSEYKITAYDNTLKKEELVFTKKYDPITKGEEEIATICDVMRDQLPFPSRVIQRINVKTVRAAYDASGVNLVKNPIFGLIPMDNGMLLVIHDFRETDGVATADIFTRDGVYIGNVSLPNRAFIGGTNLFGSNKTRMIFKNGFAYTIETRDEDNVLVRYKYKVVPAS